MGASNFHNTNASKVFVVEIEDKDDFEFAVEDITECLRELKDTMGYRESYTNNDRSELRSYPSRSLITLAADGDIGEVEITVEITAIIRSGYYAHANLDWQLDLMIDREELSNGSVDTAEIDEILRRTEWIDDVENEMVKDLAVSMLKHMVVDSFEKKIKEMIGAVENVFARLTTPCDVFAQLSNGETWYKKVEVNK